MEVSKTISSSIGDFFNGDVGEFFVGDDGGGWVLWNGV